MKLYILIGIILIGVLISLGGCVSNKQPSVNSPIPLANYDEDVLKAKAKALNIRYVDYLHALTNNKIPDLRRQASIYYQAHDFNWADDPSVNPVFNTKAEAQKYAEENNMEGHHSYEVREVDYRYEVRIGFSDYTYSNGTWKNILYTTGNFNDAYEYVIEYSSSHSDLIIYDLKTGESFEETP